MVRYLARYTSRIAMSNQRIQHVDEEKRTVTFEWKDYKAAGVIKQMTMAGATFLRCFTRHMVPKRFRRVRYFGLLAGGSTGSKHQGKGSDASSSLPPRIPCEGNPIAGVNHLKPHHLPPKPIPLPAETRLGSVESCVESRD